MITCNCLEFRQIGNGHCVHTQKSAHDVEQWKECDKCGKDYPIDFQLNHCILHRGGKLVKATR